MTVWEELEQLEKAISAVLAGGQSYQIQSGGGSRTTTMPDLAKLQARKAELENQIAAMSGGTGGRYVPAW